MATENQHRAFISYSHVNRDFATKLAKGLKAAGYPVWFDQLDIPAGARWDDEVENALRECSIFMIILTSASIASENVKDEIGYAIDRGKHILPVLLENCDIPLRLNRFQYVDFTTKSFEEGLESAKELLGGLVADALESTAGTTPVVEVPVQSKPAPDKTKSASKTPSQKKPLSKAVMIGIVILVVLILATVIGIWLASGNNSSDESTPASFSINNEQSAKVDVVNNSGSPLDYDFNTNVWQSIDSQTDNAHLKSTATHGDAFISVLQNTLPNINDLESSIPWNSATIV
jgi:TIR domain